MPLWNANSTVLTKPKYLSTEWQSNTYVCANGITWHNGACGGSDEVLVAGLGSPAVVLAPGISRVYFAGNVAAYAKSFTNAIVTVVFNSPVTVTGSPTLNVTGNNVNAVATYAVTAGLAKNKAHFQFTVPANTQTLSIVGQTITVGASNNITSASNTSVNAVVSFANTLVSFPLANGSAAALAANVVTIAIP
jgi:hypothetical protein